MNLHRLSDEARRRLALVVGAALMTATAMSAGVLGAFGRESGAGTALAIALACSFPVLAGTVTISPAAGHRLVRIGLAAFAVVALLSVALTHAVSPGA